MKKTIFITGATSGIGKATALALANTCRVIICGRRTDKLAELALELQLKTEVYTLAFDVSNKEQTFEAIASLPKSWQAIDVLINNAGNAHGLAPFQDADLADMEAMVDINIKGVLYVTKALLPFMESSTCGHIVNLSSIAGKETYMNGTVYCASKAAIEAISKGLRFDLLAKGIKVTNIAPGAVETEFSLIRFKGDDKKAASVYQGYTPLVAQDVADAICYAVLAPQHVQIADITILPKAQASATIIAKKI